jgi:UDP-glucose 4-epimerase
VGKLSELSVFGNDYDTPDGTGVRDYIHVVDLADAHVKALTYLRQGGESTTLNCGYGHGFSVREMLQAVESANGAPLNIIEDERRAGDPPTLVAGADKVREVLGWQPQHDNLKTIAESSLAWERSQLGAPWSND